MKDYQGRDRRSQVPKGPCYCLPADAFRAGRELDVSGISRQSGVDLHQSGAGSLQAGLTIPGLSEKILKQRCLLKRDFQGKSPFLSSMVNSDQVEPALVGESLAETVDQAACSRGFRVHEVFGLGGAAVACFLDMYLEVGRSRADHRR